MLIVLEGVHQAIPEAPPANSPVYLAAPPPAAAGEQPAVRPAGPAGTDADKLLEKYKQIGAAENHKFGEGGVGAKPPDFNIKLPAAGAQAPAAAAAQPQGDAATRRRGDTANPPPGQLPAKPVNPQITPNQDGTAKTGVAASPRRPVAASQQPPQ